jgi:(p)ppGpp synthase/HD superfamily hydrolase
MNNEEKSRLAGMVLAPYIQKATALQGQFRFVGGNQFRHALGTLAILMDYHYIDPVLLKASIIHDVFEDTNCVTPEEIINIDSDGRAVYQLVMEVTRLKIGEKNEPKDDYLERILTKGSRNAKILKCADRISNLTDLHTDIFDKAYVKKYIKETKKWVLPMAKEVNNDMQFELKDIIRRREKNLKIYSLFWPIIKKKKH